MSDPAERALVRRAQQRDSAAYGELVRRHQRALFNVGYRLLGTVQEAEDLAQEAFVRGYQHLDRFDPERPFGPWIRKIATNLALNRLRARRPPGLPLDEAENRLRAPPELQPAPQLERQDRAARLRAALLALPPHYRVAIELRHFQELSYAEIAAALELPINTVRSHIFRARRLLAERLEEEDV